MIAGDMTKSFVFYQYDQINAIAYKKHHSNSNLKKRNNKYLTNTS